MKKFWIFNARYVLQNLPERQILPDINSFAAVAINAKYSFSISKFCKLPCPGKEMNEPVPKRSKHDDTLTVDNVPTNSSNQATGSSKRDLKAKEKLQENQNNKKVGNNRNKQNRKTGKGEF